MKKRIVQVPGTVVLVGGGACDGNALREAAQLAAAVVAADGGATCLIRNGIVPDAVIGDMDSLPPEVRVALPPGIVHAIAEQDSTDFDKCLRHIAAPEILGFGFLGGRLDHELAAMTVLALRPEQRCILVGAEDVVVLCPPTLGLPLEAGTRLSLWPLGPVGGTSAGLKWPIDGLGFAPDGTIGTSNEVTGPVRLTMAAPRMLLILPVACLPVLRSALAAAPRTWPSRA